MLKELKSSIYHVADLEAAKKWYSDTFEISPYFDEPFYVGFSIGGSELGLDPDGSAFSPGNQSIAYWKTEDIRADFEKFRTKNVEIHEDVHAVGGNILVGCIKDPFGNVIGLIQE
jgi:predicted enzyme related to lactoylglutathione lyase